MTRYENKSATPQPVNFGGARGAESIGGRASFVVSAEDEHSPDFRRLRARGVFVMSKNQDGLAAAAAPLAAVPPPVAELDQDQQDTEPAPPANDDAISTAVPRGGRRAKR